MISTDFSERKGPVTNASHEIAHSLAIGEADDSCRQKPSNFGEIYSGSSADSTPEELESGSQLWSVMSGGWKEEKTQQPMDKVYFAFSIEELSTVNPESGPLCTR